MWVFVENSLFVIFTADFLLTIIDLYIGGFPREIVLSDARRYFKILNAKTTSRPCTIYWIVIICQNASNRGTNRPHFRVTEIAKYVPVEFGLMCAALSKTVSVTHADKLCHCDKILNCFFVMFFFLTVCESSSACNRAPGTALTRHNVITIFGDLALAKELTRRQYNEEKKNYNMFVLCRRIGFQKGFFFLGVILCKTNVMSRRNADVVAARTLYKMPIKKHSNRRLVRFNFCRKKRF